MTGAYSRNIVRAVRAASTAGALGMLVAVPAQAWAQAAAPEPQAPQEAGPERLIDVFHYRVLGNTVLPRIEMERAVLPFMGPKRKVEDIESARLALEKAYRDKGFEAVTVEVPQQDVRGGVVRFNVVELKIGQVRVVNARHFSPRDIRDRVPALQEGAVPNYRDVSAQLSLVNRSADRTVTPTLMQGAAPDTVDVDLNVEETLPFHGSLELNDRSSSRTRKFRVSGSVSYNNLFQREHSLNLQGQFAPEAPTESWVASASYVIPVQGTPFSVVAYGLHSDSDVTAVGGIGVLGTGDVVGLRGLYNFSTGDPAQPWLHQLTLGIDYKNFTENLVVGQDSANTPIDYVPVMAQYSLVRRADRYDFDIGATVTAGIRGLGATSEEFRRKRFNASASWITLRGEIGYAYKPKGDWRFAARLGGQLSGRPLIANEQYSIGGLDTVRGYYESQELGDDGASGQLQIDTPNLADTLRWANDVRVFVFADGGVTRIHDPLGEQSPTTWIGGVGAGINLRLFNRFNASTLLAVPLTDRSAVRTDIADTIRGQMRLWTNF